ncbi:AbrB/MazE/SpoVT family DNA-binding domain-containing protein [Campylobacter gastrosuis]|uniref:AbrB/MazE/SpoVT family DNA-binding domain-containing protein n=1 Tax=Campylobacter gastrosuis TaxID=2974576 RepID=A0ABT7HRH3_9BACT|nr:AbrB/MazE/SpoVT family DNA-binding domain-containing protein [Campylobacter gastrosuis]MDL0089511.1 AbrB/MazE/SpoVT family DNA-binding domain-containing protein [Campylobacter gastrosuis]
MTTNLIQIGNSQGIRLPKSIIEQFGFDKISLEILKEGVLLKPVKEDDITDWDTPELRKAASDEKTCDFGTIDLDEWEW